MKSFKRTFTAAAMGLSLLALTAESAMAGGGLGQQCNKKNPCGLWDGMKLTCNLATPGSPNGTCGADCNNDGDCPTLSSGVTMKCNMHFSLHQCYVPPAGSGGSPDTGSSYGYAPLNQGGMPLGPIMR